MTDGAGKGQRRVLDALDAAALRGRQVVHHRHDVPTDSSDKGLSFSKRSDSRILARLPVRSQSLFDRFMPRSLRPVRAACKHALDGREPAAGPPGGAWRTVWEVLHLKDTEL